MRVQPLAMAAALLTTFLGAGAGGGAAAGTSVSASGSRAATVTADQAAALGVAAKRTLPEAIQPRQGVTQLVTVSSPAWSSTTGTLRAWARSTGGAWLQVHGPTSVVLGYSGWVPAPQRKQSTGKTPAGIFDLPYAFGRLADPGGPLEYRQYDGNDWWPYEPRDPATYNIYQFHKAASSHWRAGYSEHLADYRHQYALGIVVGFNLPSGIHYSATRKQLVATSRADTSRGGGIFLHVADDGLTAGCVAMPRPDVRWLVRWLDPQRHPRVAMGPHDYLVTL